MVRVRVCTYGASKGLGQNFRTSGTESEKESAHGSHARILPAGSCGDAAEELPCHPRERRNGGEVAGTSLGIWRRVPAQLRRCGAAWET